jgi:hypothetical protein
MVIWPVGLDARLSQSSFGSNQLEEELLFAVYGFVEPFGVK